jgi:glycosyltransferase involved in cell wall biosynthesis
MKRMIFHIPIRIDQKMPSGSQIRPMKMLQAFRDLGYSVDVVMGYEKERKQQIEAIKDRIKNGEKYHFLYSESSTEPTLLTGKNHLPLYPFLDFSFFKFCKNHDISIGLFYRDIYWVFEEYRNSLGWIKSIIATFFYKYDLKKYAQLLDVLYLPSMKMLEYIPMKFSQQVSALPPALEENSFPLSPRTGKLRFLYVGGVGSVYDLRLLVENIREEEDCELTICTRKNEWEANKNSYSRFLSGNIIIEHRSGESLNQLFEEVDIAVYFLRPHTLWNFAIGIKLFEYLAHRKPILAVKGTAVGNFVEKYDVGWSIEYTAEKLKQTIRTIYENPAELERKINNIQQIIPQHTWKERARQVENDLL